MQRVEEVEFHRGEDRDKVLKKKIHKMNSNDEGVVEESHKAEDHGKVLN